MSPDLYPQRTILVYPPGLSANLGPKATINLSTIVASLNSANKILLVAKLSCLALVISGSTNLLNSLALGTVVLIVSSFNNAQHNARNQAFLDEESLLNFLPAIF